MYYIYSQSSQLSVSPPTNEEGEEKEEEENDTAAKISAGIVTGEFFGLFISLK